jgi:hypothetical protein
MQTGRLCSTGVHVSRTGSLVMCLDTHSSPGSSYKIFSCSTFLCFISLRFSATKIFRIKLQRGMKHMLYIQYICSTSIVRFQWQCSHANDMRPFATSAIEIQLWSSPNIPIGLREGKSVIVQKSAVLIYFAAESWNLGRNHNWSSHNLYSFVLSLNCWCSTVRIWRIYQLSYTNISFSTFNPYLWLFILSMYSPDYLQFQ